MGTIIAMSCLSVGSAVASGVLNKLGKVNEAQYVDFGTLCLIATTGVTLFVKVIKALHGLSGTGGI